MNSQVLIDRKFLQDLLFLLQQPRTTIDARAVLVFGIERALATPAPIPDAVEGVEVVGYQWLDTAHYRRAIPRYVDHAGVALWHELMTVAQHNRIVSALQASAMVVPDKAILVGRAELSLVRNALKLDCEQGRSVRGEMLTALDNSTAKFDAILAASPPAKGGE